MSPWLFLFQFCLSFSIQNLHQPRYINHCVESASSAAPAAPRPPRDVAASDEVVALRELLIGRKIEVYWGRDKRWYPGTVSGFEDGRHSIDCAIIATQFRPWFDSFSACNVAQMMTANKGISTNWTSAL